MDDPSQGTEAVQQALARQSALVLLGPRQVGKTTLAHVIGEGTGAVYIDLEAAKERPSADAFHASTGKRGRRSTWCSTFRAAGAGPSRSSGARAAVAAGSGRQWAAHLELNRLEWRDACFRLVTVRAHVHPAVRHRIEPQGLEGAGVPIYQPIVGDTRARVELALADAIVGRIGP
jgi:hypothetical protein